MQQLSLSSERYAANGNLAADGIRKLLGAPSLDLLQTVVREATQNSCDAGGTGGHVNVSFRLRTLTQQQVEVLRNYVFRQLPEDRKSAGPIAQFLSGPAARVLEICDFGTSGLGGPTRADVVTQPGESTDFIDFVRNLGARRDTHHGGGTYGYGKTSLYLSSRCSTILIDTLTPDGENQARRLIGCHLGEASDLRTSSGAARFTGRYWWGVPSGAADHVDPLTDIEAGSLAASLGFYPRPSGQTGTSVMVIDPWFGEDDPELVADKIRETLLWYFWPKMLSYNGQPPAMTFRVELEGQDRPLPSPEEFPPLDLFVQAMRQLKENTDPEAAVWCQRPRKLLGRLVIENGMRSPRLNLVPEDQSLIPRHCYHMAVMRPVELVVRYFEGHPLPDERVEWAGVFVCDSDDEVEAAFSAAEPPAHDDWIPDSVPKPGSTYVRVALRHIRERINAAALVGKTVTEGAGGVQPGLAKAADALGRALVPAGLGTSAGQSGWNGGAGGRSGGNRSRTRLQGPTFRELVLNGDQPAALFDLRLTTSSADAATEAVIEGEAFFVADGAPMRDADDGADAPRVIGWFDKDGTQLATGTSISVPARDTELQMLVSIPAPGAVGANVRLVSSGSA